MGSSLGVSFILQIIAMWIRADEFSARMFEFSLLQKLLVPACECKLCTVMLSLTIPCARLEMFSALTRQRDQTDVPFDGAFHRFIARLRTGWPVGMYVF